MYSNTDLAVVMIEEDVASVVVFKVSDLEAVRVADLLRLEWGIDGVHLYDSFRFFSL